MTARSATARIKRNATLALLLGGKAPLERQVPDGRTSAISEVCGFSKPVGHVLSSHGKRDVASA